MKEIKIGLLGCGTVGTGLIRLLRENSSILKQKLGVMLTLKSVAVRDIRKRRDVTLAPGVLTEDFRQVLTDPEISIVVELIGGYSPAREYVLEAVGSGKHVVTANKALLARHGRELYEAAVHRGVEIRYEAAVAGGIPVLSAIKGNMAGNRFLSVVGILNGTCNYILTKMTEEGVDFADALKKAQDLGYAEADPTFDIEGTDTAHKLSILISLCFGTWVAFNDIHVEGISSISPLDIAFAARLGYRIKLLAIGKRDDDRIEARVHPGLVPETDPLAGISGAYNAVRLAGNYIGRIMFHGRGAGMEPTASAVAGDVMAIARNMLVGAGMRTAPLGFLEENVGVVPIRSMGETVCKYYLRFSVVDRPGILAKIAGAFGENGISIKSAIQTAKGGSEAVPLVIVTHEARETAVKKALETIETFGITSETPALLRIEDDL
jgi:homoserine dehydrogenase